MNVPRAKDGARTPRPEAGRGREETPPPVTYRAVELPGGQLLPIEVRLGHRVLHTVPPDSPEGRDLLASGRVERVHPPDH
jgi:hypothetical protein